MAEIVIAEDSPTQAEQLCYLLTDAGHRVTTAGDGERALELVRRRPPTLVITDIVMPRMDGYTLCSRIKGDERLGHTPVILLTSLASPQDVVKGLACGADNFIRKPYEVDYLLARVDQILASAESRREETARVGLQVSVGGQRHFVTAERQQILDFLFSTFEETVHLNDELTRSYRSLDGIYRIADGLNRCTSERQVTEIALARACELPGVHAGWILLAGGEAEVRVAGSRDDERLLDGDEALLRDCSCRRELLSARLDHAVNVAPCECMARRNGGGAGAHATVPLRSGERVLGLLNLVGPAEGRFADDELRTLDGVGNQVGAALERALLQEHLERRVRERTAELTAEVAARRRAEEALRALAAIVESADEGMVRLAPGGVIETWNPGAARIYGYAAEEAVGRRVEMLLPPERREEMHGLCARVERGESVQGHEMARTTRSGDTIAVSLTLSPVRDADGGVVALAEISRDVTLAKQLEQQLLHAQKMDSLGRLAGGIAHDFNNLMTAVVGFGELLAARLGDEDPNREYAEEITRSGHRAAALTRRLLAFARRQEMRLEVIDLNAVVAGMEALFRRLISEEIDLVTRAEPELWPVTADPGQTEQVVMNLVLNARDAMPRGGTLTIETSNVEVGDGHGAQQLDAEPGHYALLTVSDTGVGMDAATRSRIFEPFFTTKEEGRGTGLGLSTVFGIVKQTGGHIALRSEPGQGTTFNVYLPRATDLPTAAAEPAAPARAARGVETVLIVEDEQEVRSFVRVILEQAGFTVLEPVLPAAAVAFAQEHAGAIDLLITDIMMPGVTGRDVAERIRTHRPGLPVLYMSGYANDALAERGLLEPGSAAFLAKPFTPDQLLQNVRAVLDGR